MSDYREETNKYKAKRTGIVDAKVVAPKGKKKKVAKPWVVWVKYFPNWKPSQYKFQHEHDARTYLAKLHRSWAKESWLEHNGERVDV